VKTRSGYKISVGISQEKRFLGDMCIHGRRVQGLANDQTDFLVQLATLASWQVLLHMTDSAVLCETVIRIQFVLQLEYVFAAAVLESALHF
jgi:hypothetical protein